LQAKITQRSTCELPFQLGSERLCQKVSETSGDGKLLAREAVRIAMSTLSLDFYNAALPELIYTAPKVIDVLLIER
jgi:hypothetical protein